jgi:hypothetical protein
LCHWQTCISWFSSPDATLDRKRDLPAQPKKYPNWDRVSCPEGNSYITIGKEYYLVTSDGYLMPTTKGLPPDPKYFPQAHK